MAGTVDVVTGFTLTFGTTSYAAEILGVSYDGHEVAKLKTSHMGTTGYHTYRFGDLKEGGELTVRVHFNPNDELPTGTEETVTGTFAVPSGLTNGATMQFLGGIMRGKFDLELEEVMTGEIVVSVHDDVTWADAS